MSKPNLSLITIRGDDDAIVSLPEFLFYFDDFKSGGAAPSALLYPEMALEGELWTSATTPAKDLANNKKSIIFDSSSFVGSSLPADMIGLVIKLKNIGFTIYLRVNKANKFVEITEKFTDGDLITSLLENLVKFDPALDYQSISAFGQVVSDDKLVLLNSYRRLEIEKSLSRSCQVKDNFFINDLVCNFRSFKYGEDEEKKLQNFAVKLIARSIEEVERLIADGKEWSHLFSEILDDIIKYSELIPDFAEQIYQNRESARDPILCIKYIVLLTLLSSELGPDSLSVLIKQMVDKRNNLVPFGHCLALCLKVAPNFAEKLIASYEGEILSGFNLSQCLIYAPAFAERLINEFGDETITKESVANLTS